MQRQTAAEFTPAKSRNLTEPQNAPPPSQNHTTSSKIGEKKCVAQKRKLTRRCIMWKEEEGWHATRRLASLASANPSAPLWGFFICHIWSPAGK